MSEPVGPPADQLLRLCLCIEQHLADVLEGGYSGDEMAERIPWTAVSAALLAEGIEWSPTQCCQFWRWLAYGSTAAPARPCLGDSDDEEELARMQGEVLAGLTREAAERRPREVAKRHERSVTWADLATGPAAPDEAARLRQSCSEASSVFSPKLVLQSASVEPLPRAPSGPKRLLWSHQASRGRPSGRSQLSGAAGGRMPVGGRMPAGEQAGGFMGTLPRPLQPQPQPQPQAAAGQPPPGMAAIQLMLGRGGTLSTVYIPQATFDMLHQGATVAIEVDGQVHHVQLASNSGSEAAAGGAGDGPGAGTAAGGDGDGVGGGGGDVSGGAATGST